ncbi:MAG TPA: TMEM175 family protein [Solirubrobacterales bacterium]|nr:TMEM175 family protein [Solirubrobacterales bacterium]
MARERQAKRREEHEVEFSRIVAFSDGVFAIAITLLVLGFDVNGTSGHQLDSALWDQREQLLAYAISFAVIGRFWIIHHRFFGEVTAFDGRLLGLNLLYLAWIVLIPFSSEVLGDYGGETAAVVLYSANLAGVVAVGMLMHADARRAGLTSIGDGAHREARMRSLFLIAIFVASIPLAFAAPRITPFLWLILFLDPATRLARGRG